MYPYLLFFMARRGGNLKYTEYNHYQRIPSNHYQHRAERGVLLRYRNRMIPSEARERNKMTQEQIKKELVKSKMIIKTHLKQIDDQMRDIRELKQSNKELSEMHNMAMRRVFDLKDQLKERIKHA
jgi:hypothetical protein